MSEELRDELGRLARIQRLKVQGFGNDQSSFAGNAAGVTRRQTVMYNGNGAFLISGILVRAYSLVTGGFNATNKQYAYTVMDRNLKILLSQNWQAENLNSAFENLDHGILLKPNEYLVIEVTSTIATVFAPVGVMWGDEYLFDEVM